MNRRERRREASLHAAMLRQYDPSEFGQGTFAVPDDVRALFLDAYECDREEQLLLLAACHTGNKDTIRRTLERLAGNDPALQRAMKEALP